MPYVAERREVVTSDGDPEAMRQTGCSSFDIPIRQLGAWIHLRPLTLKCSAIFP